MHLTSAPTGALRYPTPPDCDSAQSEPRSSHSTDAADKMRRQQHVPHGRHHRRDVTDPAIDARYPAASKYDAYPPTSHPPGTTAPPSYEQYRQPQYAGRAAQEAFAGDAYAGTAFTGYHSGYGYGPQYGYSAYAPVQHAQPQQAPAWNGWQPINANWQYQHQHPTPPAQQEGFAYPDQWYAHAPAAYASWGAFQYPTGYQAPQQLLTPFQDEQTAGPANAPEPSKQESVTSGLITRRTRIDKNNRNVTNTAGARNKTSRRQKQLEKNAADKDHQQPQQQLPSRQPKRASPSPRLQMMQRPVATPEYIFNAYKNPHSLDSPRPLLVILDLNGTLLFRRKIGGANSFVARPHINAFLDYLFNNHIVMVWSSARPGNVHKMCADLFTPEQRAQIVAIWARDKLNLSPAAYNGHVQVYKQLSWVWADPTIQGKKQWSQADTVLIDDSVEKAASEPFNLVRIDEFEGKPEQMEEDVLGEVMQYLRVLATQGDVSAFIRSQPFQYASAAGTTQ